MPGKERTCQWVQELTSKSSLLPCLYRVCRQKVWPCLKMDFSYPRRSELEVGLFTSNDLSKKNSSQAYPATWILINSILTTGNSYHIVQRSCSSIVWCHSPKNHWQVFQLENPVASYFFILLLTSLTLRLSIILAIFSILKKIHN